MKQIEIVVEIISEFKKIQDLGHAEIAKYDNEIFPRLIASSENLSIIVNKSIDINITKFAASIKSNNYPIRRTFSDYDIISIVRKIFGIELSSIDLDRDLQENAKIVLSNVKGEFEKAIQDVQNKEYCFPCTFFEKFEKSGLKIGPVNIEHRDAWIERHLEPYGPITPVIARRIRKSFGATKLRSRRPSWSSIQEDSIITSLGDADWVCSVSVSGLSNQAGEEKSLIAARVAMASLGLIWETPSKIIAGLNLIYDGPNFHQKLLIVVKDKIMFSARKIHFACGPITGGEDVVSIMIKKADYISKIGEILDCVVDARTDSPKEKLYNNIAQGLLWFHEGCRERLTQTAIVKFAAALDTIAGGKGAEDICKFLTDQLGISNDTIITIHGDTIKQVINLIYNEGRSRIIHGTTDKFGHDWTAIKSYAEFLSRHALIAAVNWTIKHPELDNPDYLFSK